MATCQICGREIKANKGVIAHHGYKRPGSGWQTTSCIGARFAPYEESADRISYVINLIEDFIASKQAYLETLTTNPPATLTYQGRHKTVEVAKPADFNPDHNIGVAGSYESLFRKARREAEVSIRQSEADLTSLRERLANWQPA